MNQPLVSIIVTCFNRADMVTRALTSVREQTYRPLELIVVDDGSTDHSMEVIREWCKEHPDEEGFTTVFKTFPNGKLCTARNRGLALSHGELIQYVDDDDWLYPLAVEEKVNVFLRDSSRDIVVNQVDYCYADIGPCGHSNLKVSPDDEKQLLHILDPANETYFSPTLMFRREALTGCGGWLPGLIFAEDIDIVTRLAIFGAKFGLVEKSLSVYNMHDGWRQCNQVIHQLPDSFWANLFSRLFALCQKEKKDSTEVRTVFVRLIGFYANRLVQDGRYNAAELCFDLVEKITGKPDPRMSLPRWFRRSLFCGKHLFHSGKQCCKKMIKSMIGKH